MERLFDTYVIDSNIFISIFRKNQGFPSDIYTNIFQKLEELMKIGTIVSSVEVYNELVVHDDQLKEWAVRNKSIFLPLDTPQLDVVSQIITKYPDLARHEEKTTADVFIVALAKANGYQVLSNEIKTNQPPKGKPKVPHLCEELDVPCFTLLEFMREVGWSFTVIS